MKKIIPIIFIFVISSCTQQTNKDHGNNYKVFPHKQAKTAITNAGKIIHIIPLGDVHSENINEIKSAIQKFFGYNCVVLPQAKLTTDILAPSKTRYEADKILEKYGSKEYRLILTEKDIATPNKLRKSAEWGIFGMGYQPGTTCVVSTFRLKKSGGKPVPKELFMERLQKVALHEIGHNLGLDHCTNDPQCLMNDANGTIKQVDRERIWFCNKCLSQVKEQVPN